MTRFSPPRSWIGLAALVAVGCSFSSSSTPDSTRALSGAAGASPSSGAGGATSRGGGTASGTGSWDGADAAPSLCNWASNPDFTACGGAYYQGQALPLDVFVMFDESGSMATMDDGKVMRIDAVRAAVDQFLEDPGSAGVGVGIGYFGTQPLSCACTSCDAKDYATPAVPIGALPAAAPALQASLGAQQPTGETPTGAAIRGACTYTTAHRAAVPGHAAVILLVTDGIPQAPLTTHAGGCDPTLADAVSAAQSCFAGATPIRTYVLGVGPSLDNLNQIAAAGGTAHAYLVESAGTAGVLQALGAIRQDAMIPCAMALPKAANGGIVDPGTVNLVYADRSCAFTTLRYVKTPGACDAQSGGWHYDDPSNPAGIELCPASCAAVGAPGAQLRVSVGCASIGIGAAFPQLERTP
ncbi:MAG TPA: vWA domain-containing protein [Polyangia bacterium]|nr:vWA domain-containing protein [Polyangia bacterium]